MFNAQNLNSLIIEKNVPIPNKGQAVKDAAKFLSSLKVGESVKGEPDTYNNLTSILFRAQNVVNKSGRKRISARRVATSTGFYFRFWRIK